MGDEQDLPVFLLFDVVYRRFQSGTVVEQKTRGVQVFVTGYDLVPLLRGEGFEGFALVLRGRELTLRVGSDVRRRSRHDKTMIAWGPSGMISAIRLRVVAQSGSALGWGPSGRRFESGRPDFFAGS